MFILLRLSRVLSYSSRMTNPNQNLSNQSRQQPLKNAVETKANSLEEIVKLSNKVGLEYVEAKHILDELELLKASVKAKITLRLDDGSLSEVKLKRLTEADDEYVAYLHKISVARGECEKLRVRYESYKNLFEARRSMLSYHKAEMNLV